MVYRSEHLALVSVREVLHGKVNDVVICRDLNTDAESYYTVLVIRDHETAKLFLRVLNEAEEGRKKYVEMFSAPEGFCVVFDYVKERYLTDFYAGRKMSLRDCEQVCRNLIVACIASGLPWPILSLALVQGQIHLRKDNSIQLSCALDLEKLDAGSTEGECAVLCAVIVRGLLEVRATKHTVSYQLLLKKIPKNSYQSFQELYTDIRMTSVKPQRKKITERIREFLYRNQEKLFRILLRIACILAVIVLAMVLSELIFGELPFLRLFVNTFEKIGTEVLTK